MLYAMYKRVLDYPYARRTSMYYVLCTLRVSMDPRMYKYYVHI